MAGLLLLALTGALSSAATAETPGGPAASCAGRHWVGAWSAVPSDGSEYPEQDPIAGRTSRTVLTPLFAGERIRLRLSNRFGSSPVRLDSVRIADAAGGAALRGGSSRRIHFDGSTGVTIGAGEDVVSDATSYDVRPFTRLAVSVYVDPDSDAPPTRHYVGQQTSYLSAAGAGDHTADEGPGAFTEATPSRFIVSGIDVRSSRRAGAVVAFGDSTTDGLQAHGGLDLDARYPDFLARRLQAKPGPSPLSVLNAGISGNRLTPGSVLPVFGVNALDRLTDDVIRQPGVSDAIVLEGTNDLVPSRSARPIISALRKLAKRLEREGIRTSLGTLPPNGGSVAPAEQERIDAIRSDVNRWVRRQHASDGYIDFSKALRDPTQPSRLDPRFDSGDHLHPSAAGYKAMARAVPIARLAAGCSPSR